MLSVLPRAYETGCRTEYSLLHPSTTNQNTGILLPDTFVAFVCDIGDDEEGVSAIFSINRVALPWREQRPGARNELYLTLGNLPRYGKTLQSYPLLSRCLALQSTRLSDEWRM